MLKEGFLLFEGRLIAEDILHTLNKIVVLDVELGHVFGVVDEHKEDGFVLVVELEGEMELNLGEEGSGALPEGRIDPVIMLLGVSTVEFSLVHITELPQDSLAEFVGGKLYLLVQLGDSAGLFLNGLSFGLFFLVRVGV